MSARLGLRRVGVALSGILLAVASLQAVGAATAPGAAAAPATIDLRALEQRVAQSINQARLDPMGMSAALTAAEGQRVGPDHVKLPSGAEFQVSALFLKASAEEAATQPALPALGWSETLAKNARAYVYAQNQYGTWSLGHDNNNPKGFKGGVRKEKSLGIEAIGNGDPADANTFVYRWWTSMNEWTVGAPWDPAKSYQTAGFGRGHRGIVNDQRFNAIGVGCGSPFPYSSTTYVACIVEDGNMTDTSPVAPTGTDGKPTLAPVAGGFTGSLGTTTQPDRSSLTVDTTAQPTPAPAVVALPGVAPPSDATTTPTGGCGPLGGSTTGDLPFGQYFDTRGDGCFQVTVTAGGDFSPTAAAQITGTPAAKYRAYKIEVVNRSTTTVAGPTAVTPSCYSTSAQLPLVIDPGAGQGLPDAPMGAGTSTFEIGCGQDPDGYARVSLLLGPELGGARLAWYHADGPAPAPAPASGTKAAAAPTSCPDSDTTYGARAAGPAAAALRCLINEARAARGLPPMLDSALLDGDAVAVANQQRRQYANGSACPGAGGKVASAMVPKTVAAQTARDAFTQLGGMSTFGQPTPAPLGTGAAFPSGAHQLHWEAIVVNCS